MSIIATVEQLEEIYGQPNEASIVKVSAKITPQYRALSISRRSPRWQRAGLKDWIARRAAICPVLFAFTMKRR